MKSVIIKGLLLVLIINVIINNINSKSLLRKEKPENKINFEENNETNDHKLKAVDRPKTPGLTSDRPSSRRATENPTDLKKKNRTEKKPGFVTDDDETEERPSTRRATENPTDLKKKNRTENKSVSLDTADEVEVKPKTDAFVKKLD